MPGITVAPNSPNVTNFSPSSSSSHYTDMSVAEIKARAKESVSKDARGFSALSLIKTAHSQMILAKDLESKSELKNALSAYIKAASLASMTMQSSEYNSEGGKSGIIRKELNEFIEKYSNDLHSRAAAIEEKLKNVERQLSENNQDNRATARPLSIQDRMRALQGQGMDISTKRVSRDSSNMPSSPLSPKRISTSFPGSSSLALLSTLSPTPISSTSSQHTVVSPSTLGPPSPSSSPSSSPRLENTNNFDITGFTQNFPSIDELNEDPMFNLPSIPAEINGKRTKPDPIADEPLPSVPSIRDFVPMERPSSTPVPPVTTSFVSRPASPSKPLNRPKPLNLPGHTVNKAPIPIKNSAYPGELRGYMRDYNVLLIDVRNRADFEQEHIKASAIVCIEPSVLLRENVSEEMLENAMIIAPKQEQGLFMNRDKFDLVAVYDQSSTTFGGFNTPLNVLVSAIKERAFRKMLKRMPMMLVGGLDEWKQKLGHSELARGESGFPRSPKSAQIPSSASDSSTLPVSPSMIQPSLHNGTSKTTSASPLLSSTSLSSIDQSQGHSPRFSPSISPPEVDRPTIGPQATPTTHPSLDQSQTRTQMTSSMVYMSDYRPQYSVDHLYGHSRSPAESPHPSSSGLVDSRNGIARRGAMHRPTSNSVSYTRSIVNGIPNDHSVTNGTSTSITYPQVPRRISPAVSGSSSTSNALSPQLYQSIASPPQASINPSNLSRKRSDYIDQSQEALSNLNGGRVSIDYPEIPLGQIPRPPPIAASSVLERRDMRVQHVPQRAPAIEPKPPKIESDYPVTFWSDLQVSTAGLKNLGNTCYMNAPIQCLSATVPFARFFTDGRWKNAINFTNPLGSKGKLAGTFAKLVQEMWLGDLPYLTPFEFRKSICQLKSEFIGNDQHDSQEFLNFLLDGIHEDLNRIITKPPAMHDPEQEAELERMPPQIASEQEWRAWRTRNDSLIVDFFQGQFRSQLECLTCRKTSTTYNVFSILQLPIPHARSGKVPIDQCLDAFFNEEVLEKDNSWDCPKCKVKRRATKKLSLARLPPILLVQLKRFEANGRFSDKIDTFVDYPVKSLDLTNYMPPPLPPGADKTQLNGGMPMSHDDPRTQLPPYRYDLYAVTNHYGNLSSGHYTAFIASRGGWMYCDDSSVKPVDPRQVVNQKAYLLFYKRIKA
ncbi:hypothetical protein AX15_007475 [Amanita polypyramis BW_CC]|nr:hypothetical protein AX15_007475 [Amanita polypyramis BW_CC]